MPNAIFLSYRRDDAEGEAGRLFDDLSRAFGPENVFMDVAGIQPGADFRHAIEANVAQCGVLLAIIGPSWVAVAHPDGTRRLEDPNDFVALEVGSALQRGVPVIPVLVHGARMPSPAQLPATLQNFSYRNSVELSHARWNSDVELLIKALAPYVTTRPAPASAPDPIADNPRPKKSRRPLILGISALAVVLLAVALYFAYAIQHAPNSVPASNSSLTGTWLDTSPHTGNNLSRLVISGSGTTYTVDAFGACQPTECDWGTQSVTPSGQTLQVSYSFPNAADGRTAAITLSKTGNNLNVTVINTYANMKPTRVQRIFVPAS